MSFWQDFVRKWSDDNLSGERIIDVVQTPRLPGIKSQRPEDNVLTCDELTSDVSPDVSVGPVVGELGCEHLASVEADPRAVHPGPGHPRLGHRVDWPSAGHHQPEPGVQSLQSDT